TADGSSASWTLLSAPTMGCPPNRVNSTLHSNTVMLAGHLCLRQPRAIPSWPRRPAMSIEFRERPTLEHVFQLEVWKSGALIGHVRRNPRGIFQYYRGPLNQLMYEFQDDDLDRIKKR